MTSRLRQVLAISLLFFFSLNVACGSTPADSKEDVSRYGISEQKAAMLLLPLLAEESEELNFKYNGTFEPLFPAAAIPHALNDLLPRMGKIYSTTGPFLGPGSFLLYKFLSSFLV